MVFRSAVWPTEMFRGKSIASSLSTARGSGAGGEVSAAKETPPFLGGRVYPTEGEQDGR